MLIVEDEVEIAKLIGLYLDKEGMTSTLCETAELALEKVAKNDFDLVILDLNLPGMDGFEFLRLLRKHSQVPVLILSSRKADEDMILGLGLGADDFVVKPFSPKVLVARVRAHIRRSFESQTGTRNVVRFGPFSFDKDGYALKREGERVQLSPKEFEVLDFLLTKPGTVFSAEAIYDAVWGTPYGDIATVAVHIQRLRKKTEANPIEPLYIRNIHGVGYYFNSDALQQ